MGKIIRNGIEFCGTSDTADNIIYDNKDSGLAATNTQTAIDELSEKVKSGGNIEYLTQAQYDALSDDKLTNGVEYRITDAGTMAGAENVGYNNSKSGIEAINVQDAIDKLASGVIGGAKIELLWENPNPEQNAFVQQTVSLTDTIDNYEYAIIGVKPSSTRAPMNNIVIPNIENHLTSNIETFRVRTVKIEGENAIFSDGYHTNSYNTNQVANSNVCIPIYIYGVKSAAGAGNSGSGSADGITYDNTTSGLEATTVQDAIDVVSESLVSFIGYPDMTNQIYSISTWSTEFTWTATEDCWVQSQLNTNSTTDSAYLKLNGVIVHLINSNTTTTRVQNMLLIPCKKGDVITKEKNGNSQARITVYGMRK